MQLHIDFFCQTCCSGHLLLPHFLCPRSCQVPCQGNRGPKRATVAHKETYAGTLVCTVTRQACTYRTKAVSKRLAKDTASQISTSKAKRLLLSTGSPPCQFRLNIYIRLILSHPILNPLKHTYKRSATIHLKPKPSPY